MADIKVQRGAVTFSTASATVTLPAPVGSLTRALVRVALSTPAAVQPSGTTGLGNDQVAVTAELTDVQTLTFQRTYGGTSITVYWEVWEYVGPAGGPNEFVVHDLGTISASSTSVNSAEVPADPARSVPFYSVRDYNTTDDPQYLQFQARVQAGSTGAYVAFVRSEAGTYQTDIRAYLVEFTGSNWTVEQVEPSFVSGSSNTITFASTEPWNQKFLHITVNGGFQNFFNQNTNNKASWFIRPNTADSSNTTAEYYTPGARLATVYLIVNPDLSVEHLFADIPAGATQYTFTVANVGSVDDAAVISTSVDNYQAAAFHYYTTGHQLTSTTTVDVYTGAGSPVTRGTAVQVIKFPTSTPPPISGAGSTTTNITQSGAAGVTAAGTGVTTTSATASGAAALGIGASGSTAADVAATGAAGVGLAVAGSSTTSVTATGAAGQIISGAGEASTSVTATGTSVSEVAGAAQASSGVVQAASGSVLVSGTGVTATDVLAAASAGLVASGAAEASTDVTATGSAGAVAGAVGEASVNVLASGAAEAQIGVAGTTSADIVASSVGAVLVQAAGSSATDVVIEGAGGAPAIIAAGSAAADVTNSGAADAIVGGVGTTAIDVASSGAAEAVLASAGSSTTSVTIDGVAVVISTATAAGSTSADVIVIGDAGVTVSAAGISATDVLPSGTGALPISAAGTASTGIGLAGDADALIAAVGAAGTLVLEEGVGVVVIAAAGATSTDVQADGSEAFKRLIYGRIVRRLGGDELTAGSSVTKLHANVGSDDLKAESRGTKLRSKAGGPSATGGVRE